jgi:hypothetical protein
MTKKLAPKSSRRRTPLKRLPLRHVIKASLFPVATHANTGKRLAPRHTSHGTLLILLVVIGVILYSSVGTLRAMAVSQSGQVSISAQVDGNPPTIGAAITSPLSSSETTTDIITVQGTCQPSTLVAIYNNGIFAGSTVGSSGGAFNLQLHLNTGNNQLLAKDYDALNPAGPATDPIMVTLLNLVTTDPATTTVVATPFDTTTEIPTPTVVSGTTPTPVGVVIPIVQPCYDKTSIKAVGDAGPLLSLPCVFQNILLGETLTVPATISGGKTPYALNTDWGDSTQDLKTFAIAGTYNLIHTYHTVGTSKITFRWTDGNGSDNFLQTVATINGSVAVGSTADVAATLKKLWVESPVPLYWAVLALTGGFWVGDIFSKFIKQPKLRTRRKTA